MQTTWLWAGKAYGTNVGNLFVKLEGAGGNVRGVLRFNDSAAGVVVYDVVGTYDGSKLALSGTPRSSPPGTTLTPLTLTATMDGRGNLEGEWETASGAGGSLVLHPHTPTETAPGGPSMPDQIFTARHNFGAVAIDRSEFVALAEEIQLSFKSARVIVTYVTGTEQTRFLEDFKAVPRFSSDTAQVIKLHVQEPEEGGTNRFVSVEFGPQFNSVTTQSANEAWVLGELEKVKRRVRPYERSYTTNLLKRYGIGMNQLALIAALVYMPSLDSLGDRVIFIGAVLLVIWAIFSLHSRFLPFAAIYLTAKPTGLVRQFGPSVLSWLISLFGTIVAALVGAYLKGVLKLPPT